MFLLFASDATKLLDNRGRKARRNWAILERPLWSHAFRVHSGLLGSKMGGERRWGVRFRKSVAKIRCTSNIPGPRHRKSNPILDIDRTHGFVSEGRSGENQAGLFTNCRRNEDGARNAIGKQR